MDIGDAPMVYFPGPYPKRRRAKRVRSAREDAREIATRRRWTGVLLLAVSPVPVVAFPGAFWSWGASIFVAVVGTYAIALSFAKRK